MAQDAQLISQAGQVESLASDGLVSVSTGAGQPQKNMELAKFADSLGSSVPLQQTSEQVSITGLYARTSDGKMVELTKESVASVMGNLLYGADTLAELSSGVAQQMGAVTGGRLTAWTDMDFITNDGFWTVNTDVNAPDKNTTDWALIVRTNKKGDIIQIARAYTGSEAKTYTRIRRSDINNTWLPWSRIDNFGYNTLAELSSGVAEQIGAPMMWKTTSRLESTKTPIPVNGGSRVHAYVYIISYNWSSDDATFYEYGIIRTGYSGNYVSKNIISEHKRDGTSFSVSSDSDGYVTINTTSSPLPNIHIRIMG